MPTLSSLEARTLLTVTVELNYAFDSANFFGNQAARNALQTVATSLGSLLNDNLAAVVPAGSDTWSIDFPNPANGATVTLNNPIVPANTLVIYVGGRNLTGSTEAGEGGPGGFNANGDSAWLDTVAARGQAGALATPATDFGPWGGAIAFSTTTNWYFGLSPSGLQSDQTDFYSVALHEMMHVLGIGTSSSWQTYATGSGFVGPTAEAVHGGVVPLSSGRDHWADGTVSGGQPAVMDPVLSDGSRVTYTPLDLAGLKDVGWQVSTLVPSKVQFSAASYAVNESSGTATISVTRTAGTDPVSVAYASADGSAHAGVDYTPVTGILNFAAGQTSATFTVPLLANPAAPGDVTVILALGAPQGGATLEDPLSAILTIHDDLTGIFQFNGPAYRSSTAESSATITVLRASGSTGAATVHYATSGGTAQAGTDYTPVSGTLSFAAGQTAATFTIPLLAGASADAGATIGLALSSPSGGATLGSPSTAVLTLVSAAGPRPLGDFDSDKLTDEAVFRPSTAQWFVLPSGGQPVSTLTPAFGAPNLGDIPVPGDYDGVGHTEQAVFRPSTGQWIVFGPSGGHVVATFGAPNLTDIPVPGDYDGVGHTEPAVFRPSTGQWIVLGPGGGHFLTSFGAPNLFDIPVPGDYDGVGHTEQAVFRPSTGQWIVLGPSGGHFLTTFGAPNLTDIPVPGDYDGVGHTEPAVFRLSTAQWIVLGPSGGYFSSTFGGPNLFDVPVLGPGASLAALGRLGGGSVSAASVASAISTAPSSSASVPPIIPLVTSSPSSKQSAWLTALDELAGS